jgi:hypothetical protein
VRKHTKNNSGGAGDETSSSGDAFLEKDATFFNLCAFQIEIVAQIGGRITTTRLAVCQGKRSPSTNLLFECGSMLLQDATAEMVVTGRCVAMHLWIVMIFSAQPAPQDPKILCVPLGD